MNIIVYAKSFGYCSHVVASDGVEQAEVQERVQPLVLLPPQVQPLLPLSLPTVSVMLKLFLPTPRCLM